MLTDDERKRLAELTFSPGPKGLSYDTQVSILRDVLQYGHIKDAADRHGVSHSTVRRLLRRFKKEAK
jgi:hypothetical protein